MEKKIYSRPIAVMEAFKPNFYCAGCDPDTMYTITPAPRPDGTGTKHLYMSSQECGTGSFQGPVVPSEQPITVSQDAIDQVMALVRESNMWSLGLKNGNSYEAYTGYVYVSIATNSNSYAGHITGDNVGTFHATYCDDNASQNALFIFSADGSIVKNQS